MPNRTPQDVCLLCQTRLATKRNSHIFPKFWVKSILGSDNQKEGYAVSSASEKLGQKIQDSPKEDFIFFPECESKFSILERYIANIFYNRYKDTDFANDFPITEKSGEDLARLVAKKVNPILFKLFVYSLLWRASVSTHPIFSSFELATEDKEKMRIILDNFVQNSETDTIAFCSDHISEFKSLPFNMVTTLAPADTTANMIAPFNAGDGRVMLFANEFIIIIYLDWDAPIEGGGPYNIGNSEVGIGILSLDEWHGLHSQIVGMLVKNRLNNGLS